MSQLTSHLPVVTYVVNLDNRSTETYWGHVAAFRELDDFEGALEVADTTSERRTNHQLWRLSRLVLLKYRFVRGALVLGAVSALALGLAAIVNSLRYGLDMVNILPAQPEG